MISKIIFNQITFNNLDYKKFDKFISKKGFFVFPAGPALATIKIQIIILKQYKKLI